LLVSTPARGNGPGNVRAVMRSSCAGIMCVFAMFGATAYKDASQFSSFSVALYTMFRTMCLDGWALLVEGVDREQPEQQVPVQLFFVTYIFVVVYVLIPVFVAAILDGYRTATFIQTKTDQKQKRQEVTLADEGEMRLSIDPVLHSLISATTQKQLDDKLNVLFDIIDVDESGLISYEELKMGFLRIAGGVMGPLSMEEYEAITRGGEYVNERGELDRENFKLVINEQLRAYVERKLAQYIRAVGKEDPSQVLLTPQQN